jgi:outer membrane lipoprotein-sorting protein
MSNPPKNRIDHVLRAFLFILLVGFVFACVAVGRAATLNGPDPEAILKRSDGYRNGWPSYVLHVKITNFESNKADEEKLYEVSQKGTEKTYVEFMSPREKGQHLLMLGDDMWVYLPDTSRPVRIAPLYVRSEKAGADDCYVFDLTARRKGATYQRILYWIRVQDDRPVKAEFYLTSGKLIKSATFDDFFSVGGRAQLRRMTLYDEIRHNSHSVLEYSGIAPRELPDKLFYQGRTDRF